MKALQLFGKQFSPSNWPFNLGNRNFTFRLAFFRTWLHISLWKWALAFRDEQRAQLSVTGKILANSFWNEYRVQKWWKPAYVQETQKVTARKWLCIWIFHFLTLRHQNKIIKIIFFHNFSDVHLAQTRLSCWFTVLSQAYSSVKDLQPGDLKSSSILALNTAISHRHHHLKICVLKTSGTGI